MSTPHTGFPSGPRVLQGPPPLLRPQGDPGHARHLQDLPHLCRQALELLLQQGPHPLWHSEIHRVEGLLQVPVPGVLREDPALDQGGHHSDQKQRIAIAVLTWPPRQGSWQPVPWEAGGEIGGYGLSIQGVERQDNPRPSRCKSWATVRSGWLCTMVSTGRNVPSRRNWAGARRRASRLTRSSVA